MMSAVTETRRPPHHRPEGRLVSADATSRVTSAGVLAPRISGSLMADQLQVPHCGADVQLLQHAVRAAVGRERGDAALRIVEVAEDDRLGRARLLAGGLDRAVGDRGAL